jgi:hypothetical protein
MISLNISQKLSWPNACLSCGLSPPVSAGNLVTLLPISWKQSVIIDGNDVNYFVAFRGESELRSYDFHQLLAKVILLKIRVARLDTDSDSISVER